MKTEHRFPAKQKVYPVHVCNNNDDDDDDNNKKKKNNEDGVFDNIAIFLSFHMLS